MDIYKVFVKETNLLLVKSLIILFSIISIEFLTAANQNKYIENKLPTVNMYQKLLRDGATNNSTKATSMGLTSKYNLYPKIHRWR